LNKALINDRMNSSSQSVALATDIKSVANQFKETIFQVCISPNNKNYVSIKQ